MSPTDPDSRAGLLLQRCRACGDHWRLPRSLCRACGSDQLEANISAGDGVVHAATTIHRAPGPEFADAVPYGIVLVDLDEGVRVMGRAPPDIAIGTRVRCRMERVVETDLPVFTPLA
jgi:uncharacterized OB-fold protein